MTISYSDRFSRLLRRWKGSLWKTLFKDLMIYLGMYYIINIIVRLCLKSQKERIRFLKLAYLFNDYTRQIPLTFLLGFYVGMVVKRWWEQFKFISWPDALLATTNAYIRGGETERQIRLTVARYCLLTAVLAWRSISPRVYKRFPSDQHLIDAGLMTPEEKDFLDNIEVNYDPHQKWFVPLGWVHSIFVKALEERRLSHTNELQNLMDHLEIYKSGFQELFLYDWVSIPLVYTQVATIAVYGYFAMCLVARQYPAWVTVPPLHQLKNGEEPDFSDYEIDVYIPIFTILQFLFYVGWLKVGEDLMSPFGEDDEDFELNYMIDRHAEMSRLMVDTLAGQLPRNRAFYELPEYPLPHTLASAQVPCYGPKRHIQSLQVTLSQAQIASDSYLDLNQVNQTCSPRQLLCVCDVIKAVTDCRGIMHEATSVTDEEEAETTAQSIYVDDPDSSIENVRKKATALMAEQPYFDDQNNPTPSFSLAPNITIVRNHTV